MRICYISHADSYHTIKWARQFDARGHDVHVVSLRDYNPSDYAGSEVKVHRVFDCANEGAGAKLRYLSAIPKVREMIEAIGPDVVHAHRAPSNGLVCAAACNRPYYLSIWGEDIFNFPRKTPLHRRLIEYSLNSCTWLLSTSKAMAQEARRYTDKRMEITPFGVDMDLFRPSRRDTDGSAFVVGTVKALEPRYGISSLLKACAIFREKHPGVSLELRIAGRGSQEEELKAQASALGLGDCVKWLGFIPQEKVALEWAGFDAGVVASESESESFGVSAVECQACGTPLVITDIPGLMEACNGGRTATVVPRGDASRLAEALAELYESPERRMAMGVSGREYVEREYEINRCFDRVEKLYKANCNDGTGDAE